MAKQIKIQHYYTTGTTAPNNLEYGEIAVTHKEKNEGIYIRSTNPKNNIIKIPAISENQISNWTNAANRLTEFLDTSGVTNVVDTLLDIQKVLGDEASGATNLVTTVKANTDYIADISSKTENCFTGITDNKDGVLFTIPYISSITGSSNDLNVTYSEMPKATAPNNLLTKGYGLVTLDVGDITYDGKDQVTPEESIGKAASAYHFHSMYLKHSDLTEDSVTGNTITISCGSW